MSQQQVEVTVHVEQRDGLLVKFEQTPRTDLEKLFQRPQAAGECHKRIRQGRHQSLALVHALDHVKLRESLVSHFACSQTLRDHSDDLAAQLQDLISDNPHQPDVSASVHQPNTTPGQRRSKGTGGFSVYAGAAGATRIVNVDSSGEALVLARRNMALNGLRVEDDEYVEGNVFQVLRGYRDQGRTFDVVILDPPKFASSRAQVEPATRGYKDINLVAMQVLRPGGILVTFSCSGLVSPDLFQKVVFGASVDAGRDAQILERLSQASDHPVLLSFPESEYLKGLICRVL